MPEPLPDLDFLRAAQAGDPDALSRLYERYADVLYALTLQLTHEVADAQDQESSTMCSWAFRAPSTRTRRTEASRRG